MNALTKLMLNTAGEEPRSAAGFGQPARQASLGQWLRIALLLIALIALGIYLLKKYQAANAPAAVAQEVPTVSVIVPGLSQVSTSVTFTGTIAARYELPISVEGDGGRISQVLVEAGDRVGAGQVLARLNTSVIAPQVEQLKASLEEARASAALAAADYQRARQVADSGALSREEIDRRRAAAATAAARAKVVAAQLNEARARLERTDVRAPKAGLVLTRSAEVGQTAMAGGDPLFRLAQGGQVEMRGEISEQDLPALKIGQPVEVKLTGIAQPFIGKVRLLGAVIDPQTRMGSVKIALDSDPMLRPGAFANASARVGEGQRPVLPQTAVLVDSKGSYVFVVGADNRVSRMPVRINGSTDKGVIIEQGLTGSEQVVSAAAAFLTVGEVVNPTRIPSTR